MEPGRELDVLVFEKVMGWVVLLPGCDDALEEAVPHYSTDIAAVWEIVEKFKHSFGVGWSSKWGVSYCMIGDVYEYAETIPLAICLAALKALGIEVKNEAWQGT